MTTTPSIGATRRSTLQDHFPAANFEGDHQQQAVGPSENSSNTLPSSTPFPLKPALSEATIGSYATAQSSSTIRPHQEMSQRNGAGGGADREPLIPRTQDPAPIKKADSLRRKLRSYEAFLALRQGYMPDTQQITDALRHILGSSVLDSRNRRLSGKGRGFIRDVRAWIEAVMDLMLSKNFDDKVQEFIFHTAHAGARAEVPDVGGAVRGAAVKGGMGAVGERLREVAGLLWSSREFRALANELAVVGRDMFADTASQVAATASQAAETAGQTDVNITPENISLKAAKEKGAAVSESARKATYQFRDDLESYLREKFPKQRRDAIINRLKKVVQDIQENPEFKDTANFILDVMRKYANKIKGNLAKEGKKAHVEPDEDFEVAMKDVQALLMVFANGRSLDPIHDALQRVVNDIQSDKELREFYDDVANEFNRLLTEQGYVTTDAADAEAHKLYERSQELLDKKTDRYRPDVEALFAEARIFLDAMRNDKESRRVVTASKKVYNDLVITDRNGAFRGFRKRILWDLLEVTLPRFIDEIRYVPIPRIEYQDAEFDLILENVVLESDHFLPSRTILEAFTRFELTNSYTVSSDRTTTIHLHVSSLNLFFRDAAFIVRKKTGIFSFSDRGNIDVFITGRGASADITLESSPDYDEGDNDDPSTDSYFRVKSVDVKVDSFKYNYKAYHTWASAMLSPIIRPAVRRLLSRVLAQRIQSALEMMDRELFAAAERVRVATIANRGGGSVESWIRAVLSRPEARRRRHPRNGAEWRVSVGDDGGLLFPGEYAPGGVIAKMRSGEERVRAAGEEGGWRNQIFDIQA